MGSTGFEESKSLLVSQFDYSRFERLIVPFLCSSRIDGCCYVSWRLCSRILLKVHQKAYSKIGFKHILNATPTQFRCEWVIAEQVKIRWFWAHEITCYWPLSTTSAKNLELRSWPLNVLNLDNVDRLTGRPLNGFERWCLKRGHFDGRRVTVETRKHLSFQYHLLSCNVLVSCLNLLSTQRSPLSVMRIVPAWGCLKSRLNFRVSHRWPFLKKTTL